MARSPERAFLCARACLVAKYSVAGRLERVRARPTQRLHMRGREHGTMTSSFSAFTGAIALAVALPVGVTAANGPGEGESGAVDASLARAWVPMENGANPEPAMLLERWQLLVWDDPNPPRPAVGNAYAVAGSRLLYGAFAGGFNAGEDLVRSRFSDDTEARGESAEARGGQSSR